jgi:putative FmdB family regulatory protein
MTLYIYNCKSCGEFQDWQAMTACDQPAACPRCGRRSRRVVSAPTILGMDANLRKAHARNERSAHEPRVVRRDKQKPHDQYTFQEPRTDTARIFIDRHARR